MSSGDYGDVGVGGLATAGGIGFLARKHGLTIDHVVARRGRARRRLASCDADEDLLWALRGAGGNFGIVTALELEAYPVGNVVFSTHGLRRARHRAGARAAGATLVEAAPRELTSFLTWCRAAAARSCSSTRSTPATTPTPRSTR